MTIAVLPRIHRVDAGVFVILRRRRATRLAKNHDVRSVMYVERLNRDLIWVYLDPDPGTLDSREEDLDKIDDKYFDLFFVLVI